MSESVWTWEFQGAFEQCRYLLGDELLAFLANAPQAHADDPRAVRAARKLVATLDLLEQEDPRLPVALVRKRVSEGLPLAWGMRQANGGEVPEPQGSDELALVLTRIARDVYPVLLAPSAEMIVAGPGLTFPVADVTIALDQVVESHPEHRRAVALLDDTGVRRSDLVVASALSVEPLSEIATPSSLMTAAVRRLRSVENPDAARLMGLVIELLGESRALADGRKTMVPAHIGFTALPLESGDGVALPQGTLRASTKSERRFVPFMLQAQAEAVLSTTVVCQPLESGQDTTAPQAEGQTALNRLAREVVLAAALSSSVDVPHSCPWVTWIVAHAVGRGSTSYRPLHPERAPGRVDPLTKGEIEALEHWASHVAGVDLQHVEIAVDRTLRAIWETERTDSLIDAVIAWENLVGTRNETTYRVTAALAVLCQDDLEKRIATRKDLALTYNARSRVVHGDPAPTDLHEHRSLAIQTALEALRRLMTERQDLLALASSDKRADRLLLGIRKNGP